MNERITGAAGAPAPAASAKFRFSEATAPDVGIGHYLILLRQRYTAGRRGRAAEGSASSWRSADSGRMTFVTQL